MPISSCSAILADTTGRVPPNRQEALQPVKPYRQSSYTDSQAIQTVKLYSQVIGYEAIQTVKSYRLSNNTDSQDIYRLSSVSCHTDSQVA